MAKTIKFNLILDDYPVRNIEGLREHFSIEDILKYYEKGLLLRWLKVRGYDKLYEAVESIDKSLDKKEIVIALAKIFEVTEMDEGEIEKTVRILDYIKEENELNAIYKENAAAKDKIIEDYHVGYIQVIENMEENPDNMAVLKAAAIHMEREYLRLFEYNHRDLFFRLYESAPKAIFAILTRDKFRKYWIDEGANKEICEYIKNNLLVNSKVKEVLGDDLKIVKKDTQQMWDPIERPEVKLMVISIENGTFVKNAGEFSEKLSATDVNYKLLKFNGLEYQCNIANYELMYMEA